MFAAKESLREAEIPAALKNLPTETAVTDEAQRVATMLELG
jgi:hypothetical protein